VGVHYDTLLCLSVIGGHLAMPTFPPAAAAPLAQLLVLDEAGEHLGLHEELQELAHATGRVRLAEAVALQLAGAGRRLDHVQRVVAHQLHEKTHEGLRHQRAQLLTVVWGRAPRELVLGLGYREYEVSSDDDL